jgi:type IV secretory pathway VirB3-like protein
METLQDYAIPVHRSIMKRDLFLGVPPIPLAILVAITIFMVVNLHLYWFLALSGVLYLVLKKITEKDEWLLDIILNSLFQPDRLR